jgi:hypothetical protein
MRRTALALMSVAGGLFVLGGCSVAGQWRVKADESGQKFPFYQIDLREDGQYVAKGNPGGQERTFTGKYKWSGMELTVMPQDGETRKYPGSYNAFTEELTLNHEHEGHKVKATLEKVETQPQ